MSIERDADDVARCFLLERELFDAGLADRARFDGEVIGLIGAGAFVAFGERLRGHAARAAAARRLVGAQRAGHDPRRARRPARRSASGDPVEVARRTASTRRAGRVDLDRPG